MRVEDKPKLKGADLFAYLKEHKEEIIRIKKSMPIKSHAVSTNYAAQEDKMFGFKGHVGQTEDKQLVAPEEPGNIMVRVVANASMIVDSHQDVLTGDCWNKSVKENGPTGTNIISHIHDHIHEVGAKIGVVKAINTIEVDAKTLGYPAKGRKKVKVLAFDTEVKRFLQQQDLQYVQGRSD